MANEVKTNPLAALNEVLVKSNNEMATEITTLNTEIDYLNETIRALTDHTGTSEPVYDTPDNPTMLNERITSIITANVVRMGGGEMAPNTEVMCIHDLMLLDSLKI